MYCESHEKAQSHTHFSELLFSVFRRVKSAVDQILQVPSAEAVASRLREGESLVSRAAPHTHTHTLWLGFLFVCNEEGSLVPRPLPRKVERGSGVLIDISCHMGQGLWRKECHIYILHPGFEFSDNLDCCTVWFTKT